MRMRVIILSVLLIISFSLINAGGIVKVKHSGSDQSSLGTSTMFVQDGMLRMESKMDGENHIMIFDSEKEIMYNIDAGSKTYMAITKEDFKKVGQKMNDAMKQLEEQMKNLPKEQQEMMKKMMDGNMSNLGQAEEVEKTEYKKVKSGIELNGWDCDQYIGTVAGEKVEDVWVTDWKDAGLGEEYTAAFDKLKSFFNELVDQMGSMGQQMTDGMDSWLIEDGVPIKTIAYENGVVESTVIVEEIKEESLSASIFKVPDGYTKENPFEQL